MDVRCEEYHRPEEMFEPAVRRRRSPDCWDDNLAQMVDMRYIRSELVVQLLSAGFIDGPAGTMVPSVLKQLVHYGQVLGHWIHEREVGMCVLRWRVSRQANFVLAVWISAMHYCGY